MTVQLNGQVVDARVLRGDWGRVELDVEGKGTVACMGSVASKVRRGDMLSVQGTWTKHPTYGEQFKVASFQRVMPSTKTWTVATRNWVEGLPHIGRVRVREVERLFPEGPQAFWEGLETEEGRAKVLSISGISEKRLAALMDAVAEVRADGASKGELLAWGWTEKQIEDLARYVKRVTEAEGGKATGGIMQRVVEALHADPYFPRFELKLRMHQVDASALAMGVERQSDVRVEAWVRHGIARAQDQTGSTWVPWGAFRQHLIPELIGRVTDVVHRLLEEGVLVERIAGATSLLCSAALDQAERTIAAGVAARLRTLRCTTEDVEVRRQRRAQADAPHPDSGGPPGPWDADDRREEWMEWEM